MINQIVCQTSLYGNRDKNNPNFYVTGKEIRKILGILLLSYIVFYLKSTIIGLGNKI